MPWDFLRSSYDAVAETYAATFDDELDRKPRDRELLAAFAASTPDPIVDLGCGPGHVGRFVRQAGRRVVGIDLSAAMAGLARDRLDGAAVADMRALPIGTDRLGGIVAFYSLIHLQRGELGLVLEDLCRVLRPGGRLLFTVHGGAGTIEVDELLGEPVHFAATLFALDELLVAVNAAGLDVTLADQRPPYPDEHPTDRLTVEATKPIR